MRPETKLSVFLLLHDFVAIYICFAVAHYSYFEVDRGALAPSISLFVVMVVTLLTLYIMNVYTVNREVSATRWATRAFVGVAISGILISTTVYVTKAFQADPVLWRGVFLPGIVGFAVWVAVSRFLTRALYHKYAQEPLWLVVGAGDRAAQLVDDTSRSTVGGRFQFVAENLENPLTEHSPRLNAPDIVATLDDMDALISEGITGIILATETVLADKVVEKLMTARLKGVKVHDLSEYYEKYLMCVPVMHLKDRWFVFSTGFNLLHQDIALKIKRLIDVVVAGVGLVLLLPVMVLVAVAIKIDSHGPILFSQLRTGLKGKAFSLHKFRTMVKDADREGAKWTTADDPRITKLGRFLRIVRLDELPQLWNVLVGEMSFIGPRPEQPSFTRMLEHKIPYYDMRHVVKPGITGWAQVMYGYGASIEDARRKLEYDLYYIKNYSLFLDLYILLKTLRVIFYLKGR